MSQLKDNQAGGIPFYSQEGSLFVPSRPSTEGWGTYTLGRATYFTQSNESNVNLIQEHPHRYTQNNI